MADTSHGGARRNAGRKPGSTNKVPSKSALAQARFAELVEPELVTIFDVLLSIVLNEPDSDGKRLYRGSEQIAAARELLDRGLGKPTEHIELHTDAPQLSAADLLDAWTEEPPKRRRKKKDPQD